MDMLHLFTESHKLHNRDQDHSDHTAGERACWSSQTMTAGIKEIQGLGHGYKFSMEKRKKIVVTGSCSSKMVQ